jgi:hypothetical protein
MTFEDRVVYVKRLHELGISTIGTDPTELHFRAVAAAEHVWDTTPVPGWGWIQECGRRAKALWDLGLDMQGRPRV